MADVLLFTPVRVLDINANPGNGYVAYFYQSGTTTPVTVYTDSTLATPHGTSVTALSTGKFPAVFSAGGAIKCVIKDALGATVDTVDPVASISSAAAAASGVTFSPTADIPDTNVQAAIEQVQQNLASYIAQVASQAGTKDYLINGNFARWSIATSITSAGYAADQWMMGKSGGTVTFSRQSVTLGDTFGPNSPLYHARLDVTGQSGAGDYAVMTQRIEGARTFTGQTVTVLGYVKRNSGSGNLAIDMSQVFGTGGSPSAQVNIAPVQVSLTTAWAPFAATFIVPSVAGKTLGSNGDSYLQLAFWISGGSTYNSRTGSLGIQTLSVDFWGLQILRGSRTSSDAALYAPPSSVQNQEACERFYETGTSRWDGLCNNGTSYSTPNPFRVEKRATPTIALTNVSNTSFPITTSDASTDAKGFWERRTANASANGAFVSTWTADAQFNAAFS